MSARGSGGSAQKYPRRHLLVKGLCWCGSTHSWELAKTGVCECEVPHCPAVHQVKVRRAKP